MFDFSNTKLSASSSPFVLPPYEYRDNEMFTITVKTTQAFLRTIVPEPMEPNPECLLVIYVGWLHVAKPAAISYGEAGLMVPVTLGDRPGTYIPVMYLDETELLTSGREVWGFPKFHGDITFSREGNQVEARVTNGGIDIIKAQMTFDHPGEPRPVYDREHFLHKSIPSVDGTGYDVRQLNTCLVRGDNRKEIWEGSADLQLDSSPGHPLAEIPVETVVSSIYTVGDIILDQGEVIHDYLADAGPA